MKREQVKPGDLALVLPSNLHHIDFVPYVGTVITVGDIFETSVPPPFPPFFRTGIADIVCSHLSLLKISPDDTIREQETERERVDRGWLKITQGQTSHAD